MVRRARRYRKKSWRRKIVRKNRRLVGAIRAAYSVSKKMAGEVKKADANAFLPNTRFVQIGLTNTTGENIGLADFGAVYQVFNDATGSTGMQQGLEIDDFIGNQIRTKYLYLGIHLQTINQSALAAANPANSFPITMRCMVVQDRNYNTPASSTSTSNNNANVLSIYSWVRNLFGLDPQVTAIQPYGIAADYTLLPINPQEPGRFRVLRDFKMSVAPGWRQDTYKKIYIRQSHLNSKGRIYFGTSGATQSVAPGDIQSVRSINRNALYVLFFYQVPQAASSTDVSVLSPIFNLSVQSRLAYYDN